MPKKFSKRPLSPHLQVYKLPYNAKMSIAGRGVGIGLSIALSVILLWLTAILWVPALYEPSMAFLNTIFVRYAMIFAFGVVLFYIGNGIRHVIWDMAIGLNVKFGELTGHIVLILSIIGTAILWLLTPEGQGVFDMIQSSLSVQ